MASNTPTLTDLKQYLKKASKEDLMAEIAELYKRSDSVKDYYQVKLSPEADTQVCAKYKKTIEDEFFPKLGIGKARLSIAQKAVSDYKKFAETPANVMEMMIFYVEQGVRFTNAYGDIGDPFYNSMESMYENALELVIKYNLQATFQERCRKIVKDTSHIGWEFHDGLSEIYSGTFDDK